MNRATLLLAACVSVAVTAAASAEVTLTYDISGTESWDGLGDDSNTVLLFDVGADSGYGNDAIMTGVGWDVSISTEGASWLSEANMYFDDNVAPDEMGLFLAPGAGDNFAGEGDYASDGILDLSDEGLDDIPLPDGMLRIEFFENYDDVSDALDATYTQGMLTIVVEQIPAPGAMALLGIAGLVSRRRRRS